MPSDAATRRPWLLGLVEQAPDPWLVVDAAGAVVYANAAAGALFGRSREALVGASLGALCGAALGDVAALLRGAPTTRAAQVRGSGGAPRDVSVHLARVDGPEGPMLGVYVREPSVHADVRELRAVLDECPVAISLIRPGGALEVNREARLLHGENVDADAGLAQFAGSLSTFDGDAIPFEQYPAMRALRGERVERVEYAFAFQRPDGRVLPIELSAAPLRDPEGGVAGAVVVWQDISAAKELERLRAEWSSIVAHDLRQPIHTIALFSQVLARSVHGLPEAARRPIEVIGTTAARLARMTGDLLDLSRLDARRLTLAPRAVDVVASVRDAVDRVALEVQGRAFEVATEGEIPVLSADPDRLAQILENLLTNALKYGRAATPIRVIVERQGGDVAVAVRSEGEPIPSDKLARLFQRFQRGGIRAHHGVAGIGLGLQIAQGLVEAHGGVISGESTAAGITTFRFTLPIVAPPPDPGGA